MSRPNHTLHLILAIVATIFCCLPLGIVAIVFAVIGMSREGSGDYAGAESAARTALICNCISIGLGLAAIAVYLLIFIVFGLGIFGLGFLADLLGAFL